MKKNIAKKTDQKYHEKFRLAEKQGFTLVELLIVIAIIGILAGVVTVSMNSSVSKSKRASALTTASSVLPELVTCADDDGVATITAPTASTRICCTTSACSAFVSGHDATWPDIATKTGWAYGTPSGTLSAGTYQYTLTKSGETTIICSLAKNGCE